MTTNVNQYPNGTSTAEPLNYPIYSLSLHFKLSFALARSVRLCARSPNLALVLRFIIIIPIGIIWILKLRNSPKQSAEFQFSDCYMNWMDSFISIFIVDRFLNLSSASNIDAVCVVCSM